MLQGLCTTTRHTNTRHTNNNTTREHQVHSYRIPYLFREHEQCAFGLWAARNPQPQCLSWFWLVSKACGCGVCVCEREREREVREREREGGREKERERERERARDNTTWWSSLGSTPECCVSVWEEPTTLFFPTPLVGAIACTMVLHMGHCILGLKYWALHKEQ